MIHQKFSQVPGHVMEPQPPGYIAIYQGYLSMMSKGPLRQVQMYAEVWINIVAGPQAQRVDKYN